MLTAAQQQQVEELVPAAKRLAARFARGARWAEDLESEAYMGLIAAVQKHKPQSGPLPPYCHRVMSYYMLRYLARERKHLSRFRPSGALGGVPERTPHYSTDHFLDARTFYDRLPARDKGILALYYGFNGDTPQTFREIGDGIGLTEARVQQIARRALAKLGRFAAREGEEHVSRPVRQQDHGRTQHGKAGAVPAASRPGGGA